MHIAAWLICMSLPMLFISGQTWYNNGLALLLSLAMSLTIETTYRWWRSSHHALHAEARKTAAELSFLKAQLHPHFLFNTLNNIYSLAMSRHEYTATSILKLSNMMRYATTDTHHDYVLLQREIECMNDYIDLQKLRLTDRTRVKFSVSGNPGFKCIAPLLLLPFLENAFKYGVSNQEPSDIIINLSTTEHSINFYCSNKHFTLPEDPLPAGYGIANTRERLQYLYPDKYELNIREEEGVYMVRLDLVI